MATKKTTKKIEKTEEKSDLFAVIKTGGKQYLVKEGQKVKIEVLAGKNEGDAVVFDEVFMVAEGVSAKIGTPTVAGAKVEAKILKIDRYAKIDVVKYKAKSRYHKKRGHRQTYALVEITKIK